MQSCKDSKGDQIKGQDVIPDPARAERAYQQTASKALLQRKRGLSVPGVQVQYRKIKQINKYKKLYLQLTGASHAAMITGGGVNGCLSAALDLRPTCACQPR